MRIIGAVGILVLFWVCFCQTGSAQPAIEVEINPLKDQVSAGNPFLSENPNDLLPDLSRMMNDGVRERSTTSFESLRRRAFLGLNQTILQEFLSFRAARQSS